jgi:GNAT superfamily N-acetyltransferase
MLDAKRRPGRHILIAMAPAATDGGVEADRAKLDLTERHFWRDAWESVPPGVRAEHGIEARDFGPVQATAVTALPDAGMMNLVLGAAAPGAVAAGHLAAATGWMGSRGISCQVPVTPGLPEAGAAEAWLEENGFSRGYAWMKFVRDPHPPRFAAPEDIEVVRLSEPDEEPFGMIAATGFGMPTWASTLFADLPGRERWHCYVARVDGAARACAAMFVRGGVAELGIAATLEPARGRGCQLALLRRRILDAADAGCHTLFVETGERVPGRPSSSYRNILRAGFKEAYLRPNWVRR